MTEHRTQDDQRQKNLPGRDQELAAIYRHVPAIMFFVSVEPDDDFRFVSMSDAGLRITGLTREQVVGSRVRDIIPPPAWHLVLSRYREAIQSGQTVRWREVSHYPAGRLVGDVAVTPLYDPDGVATHLIGIVHDVTDHERLEEVRQLREGRLRLALDACGGGSWTWEADTNSVDWDDGFRIRYGFTPDERPTHEGWLSRVHEEDRSRVLALLTEMLQTQRASWDNTFRIVRPDGSQLWIQSVGRAQRDADGHVLRLTGLDVDVTAQRLAEEALQAQRDEAHNHELRLLLETATQGIVSVDAHGHILMANRAMEAMFGWRPDELIGQSIERLIPRSVRDRHAHHRTTYFANPRPRLMGGGLELVGERKDGSTFPIEVSLNHVGTPSDGHAIAFVTEISDRRRAITALHERTSELEQRTVRLRQMASELTLAEQRAREQLAKTIHDGLQQQLVAAVMHLERMQRDMRMGRASIDDLDELKNQLDDAIVTSRSLSVELYPPLLHTEGLPAALAWLAEWHRTKYGLDVRVRADPRANPTRRDVRILLFESVRELLFNVVKHARVNRVTVAVAVEPTSMLGITVTDDGVGFDPVDVLARTKVGEIGWGLFSIRERLTLLGGRFDINSRPGQGTRFHLSAPRGEHLIESADPTTFDAIASSTPPRALRILIADDHAAIRKALRSALQEHSEFDVVGEAADGLEAVREARVLQPDVILIDVSMPRMDGVEATRRLHTEFPFIQILGLSMYAEPEVRRAIEEAGAIGFYTKTGGTQPVIDHLLILHATRRSQST